VNHAFLAAATPVPPPAPRVAERKVILESLDGTQRLPLDGSTGWWRMAGSTGLEMPPFDVVTGAVPGVAGSMLQDTRVGERIVTIPMFTASSGGHVDHLEMLDAIRRLVDPLNGMFRVVAISARSERELAVVYTGGLEGSDGRDESGTYWRKLGLTAIACDPFAYDRADRLVEFQVGSTGTPFLGVVGGTDAPWPGALGSSAVIGSNMQVQVRSEVPVYPALELVGPMDSFAGTLSPVSMAGQSWSVSIPAGVPAGSSLRLVTSPRARSIRMDGQLAAGRVARGSTLRPFYPGLNVLDVAAPGGTEETRIRLSWREAYRSLW
jgi:hypothetical protein